MKKKEMKWLLFSTILVLLATVGITYAWFMQDASMTTLLKILPPDTITIIPISEVDGSEMTELDLDFHDNNMDRKDADGTIHIFRPVCIKSTSPIHRLEIVHTTNLSQLTFRIYPATKGEQGMIYDPSVFVSGEYKNQDPDNTSLAKKELLENYQNTADVADVHAYPLYWLAVNCAIEEKWQEGWQKVVSETQKGLDPVTKTEKDFYNTYYYIEISWKEDTKETDLFYVMAQNIA